MALNNSGGYHGVLWKSRSILAFNISGYTISGSWEIREVCWRLLSLVFMVSLDIHVVCWHIHCVWSPLWCLLTSNVYGGYNGFIRDSRSLLAFNVSGDIYGVLGAFAKSVGAGHSQILLAFNVSDGYYGVLGHSRSMLVFDTSGGYIRVSMHSRSHLAFKSLVTFTGSWNICDVF